MKRCITSLLLVTTLLAAAAANAQQHYGWSVSANPSQPCANTGFFAPGFVTLYLWYSNNSPDGLSAADIAVVTSPPGAVTILAFNTSNGFLNAGSSTGLLLAVGGCPDGPIAAGNWIIQAHVPSWELCLGGNNLSVDCQINPVAWPNEHLGFANQTDLSGACCSLFGPCEEHCGTVSVDSESWGGIKSMYR
jgi:hypothetical protein